MKDAVICFRINKDLRSALEKISERNRRSLSSTIEYILHEHISKGKLENAGEERRRYARKTISEPALLRDSGGLLYPGMTCDLSEKGIRVSAPADFPCNGGKDTKISVVFALPGATMPLTVQCALRHVNSESGRVHVGASFIDDGSPAYDAIRRCVVN